MLHHLLTSNHVRSKDDNTTVSKITAMIVLFTASMTLGLLPIKLAQIFKWRTETKDNTYVRLLLAFGGGVLLCTTFLHLLPEVAENLEENDQMPDISLPTAELLMCTGFFIIYFVEECVHVYLHKKEADENKNNVNVEIGDNPEHSQHAGHSHIITVDSTVSTIRGLLMVLALSIHELFEGLSVGLENTTANVWYMLGAVSAHKLVIAFCIGVELVTLGLKNLLVVIYVFTFAVVSPMGIGIGLLVSGSNNSSIDLVSVLLQGLASGTLLYVVYFEILTAEKRTGIKQFLAILIGFMVMTGFTLLDRD